MKWAILIKTTIYQLIYLNICWMKQNLQISEKKNTKHIAFIKNSFNRKPQSGIWVPTILDMASIGHILIHCRRRYEFVSTQKCFFFNTHPSKWGNFEKGQYLDLWLSNKRFSRHWMTHVILFTKYYNYIKKSHWRMLIIANYNVSLYEPIEKNSLYC